MEDTIDDVIVKVSLAYSNLDISKANLYYDGRQ